MEVILLVLNILIAVMWLYVVIVLFASRKMQDKDETAAIMKRFAEEQRDSVAKQIANGTTEQFQRFGLIHESINRTLQENRTEITATLESKIKSLQDSNEKRLEQMQGVVDEKLQKTLETRLAQSFELVGKQLDSVQQGLGEMKNLAADAKSLKNALINVKERGTYGEVRLEKLLSDILAPSQYETNAEIAGGKRVEFAVKLPGNGDEPLLLPIDSKFPIEDYNRLLDAEDKQTTDEARKALAQKFRSSAKEIHDKYIMPPKTTDFALMFLPTEGLYAEVVQNAALFEELRDKYKVTAVGATTLSAFLSSLQMGFKTLAIEQRSQEVWDTLRAVKSEFGKFGDILDKAHKQIQTADKTLEEIVGTRTRAINRTLRTVDEFGESNNLTLIDEE
jgi:DNA recombination protein RmuC